MNLPSHDMDGTINKVRMIIGGQFGSEGKGAVTQWLVDQEPKPKVVVRTGGPNAGHSMKIGQRVYKMRQLPCAWQDPTAILAIGPGSIIDEEILREEILMVQEVTKCAIRLLIDPNAVLIEPRHKEWEARLLGGIGSTAKGVGAATADRVMRLGTLAGEGLMETSLAKYVGSLPRVLHDYRSIGYKIFIESSQGFGLSLTRSGYYPYTTSRDLTPAQIINDAGVPHNWPLEVISVFRTYPIRVAGMSGPLVRETSWATLSERTGGYIEEERTTVTKKIRRVGDWDHDLAWDSCFAVQPDWIALTFYDYIDPEIANQVRLMPRHLYALHRFQRDLSAPIRWVGTGFGTIVELTPKEREMVKNGNHN